MGWTNGQSPLFEFKKKITKGRAVSGWSSSQKVRKKKQGKRVLRKRKKGVRVLIILQYGKQKNVDFGSNLTQ